MHMDIYLTIGLYVPIGSIINYFLAKKLKHEYFWELRLQQDYLLNNPLSLPYSLLYKLHYEYTPGTAISRSISVPIEFTTAQILNILDKPITNGTIITCISAGFINGEIAYNNIRNFIYYKCKLVYVESDTFSNTSLEIDLINKYPCNYFNSLGIFTRYKLNLELYFSQIKNNQIENPRDGKIYKSDFINWRGEKHNIYYDNIINISKKETIYVILGNNISTL
jgi:hypothetical protein